MKNRISAFVLCVVLSGVTAALAHNGFEHVMGTVTAVSADSVTVQTVGAQKSVTVAVLPATKYLKSGAAASMKDLKVGERVMIDAKENAASHNLEAAIVTFGKQPAPKPAQ